MVKLVQFRSPTQYGGYHIHVQLNEHDRDTIRNRLLNLRPDMPPDTPILVEMSVFEDCVLFTLQDSDALVVHVDDWQAVGSVVFFYHADGTLWRVVPLEQLNPGWVLSTYRFRGDLRKFDARLARMRCRPVRRGKHGPRSGRPQAGKVLSSPCRWDWCGAYTTGSTVPCPSLRSLSLMRSK